MNKKNQDREKERQDEKLDYRRQNRHLFERDIVEKVSCTTLIYNIIKNIFYEPDLIQNKRSMLLD